MHRATLLFAGVFHYFPHPTPVADLAAAVFLQSLGEMLVLYQLQQIFMHLLHWVAEVLKNYLRKLLPKETLCN